MIESIWGILLVGFLLGAPAGFSPGPMLVLIISETLRRGIHAGAKLMGRMAGERDIVGNYFKRINNAYFASDYMSNFAYVVGILTALLTAFYSWRLLFLTFHGNNKSKYFLFRKHVTI